MFFKRKGKALAIASRDVAMKRMQPAIDDLAGLISGAASDGCCNLKLRYNANLGGEDFCHLTLGQKDTLRKWAHSCGYEWREDYFGDVTLSW